MTGIVDFYEGKTILITGVTGFVGKFLLEKLLRCCNPSKVYVLIRAKKGLTAEERLSKFFEEPVFTYKLDKSRLCKVQAITGDVEDARVIFNNKDAQKVLDEVQIVFHSAANVKFNETYSESFQTNVAGTNNVLNFCKNLQNLEVFVYVSTYASQIHRDKILEDVNSIVPGLEKNIAEHGTCDISWLEKFCEPYASNETTTYTFTKNIAESLVKVSAEVNQFPAVIARPPLLNSPRMEPEPGLTDDPRQGLIAVSQSIFIGLSKVLILNGKQRFVYNYVDVLVNAVIVSAWDVVKRNDNKVTVYNVCELGLTIDEVVTMTVAAAKKSPSIHTLRPLRKLKCVDDTFRARIHRFFAHWLFAQIMDTIFRLSGHKLRIGRAVKKLHRFQKLGGGILFGAGCEFECDNLNTLSSNMTEQEKKTFFLTCDTPDQEYVNLMARSMRKYILKEDPCTIPAAKKRLKRMSIACNILYYTLVTIAVATLLLGFSITFWPG